MEDFLKELGINKQGHFGRDGEYIVDIESANAWGTIYSKLDNSDLLEPQEDSSLLTDSNASLIYFSDDYQLTLIADFNNDSYKLVVSEF